MFIYPMWDSESQRIGKRRCTRWGARLHTAAEVIGFLCLLLLVGTLLFLGYRRIAGTFHSQQLWLLAVPLVITLCGDLLFAYSWKLADRNGFRYDHESREASWVENGRRVSFRYESAPREPAQ